MSNLGSYYWRFYDRDASDAINQIGALFAIAEALATVADAVREVGAAGHGDSATPLERLAADIPDALNSVAAAIERATT